MHEQPVTRQQRLAREKAVYRYTTALEGGDIETIAAILQQAEQDHLLEQMILEVHNVYQDEDRTVVHPDEVIVVQDLLLTLLSSKKMTEKETMHEASLQRNIPLFPHAQKGTRERMQQDTQTQPDLSTPFQEDEHISVYPSTRMHRWHALTQTLAAVLVVVALLGSFLVLFASRHTVPGGPSRTWKVVPGPNAGLTSSLSGVTAISAGDVWALGWFSDGTSGGIPYKERTLIERWNGTRWSVVPSPSTPEAVSSELSGVTAVSASDVWAVGSSRDPYSNPYKGRTLIEHWNGTRWSIVPSPNSGPFWNELSGVAAVSANDIWAVGSSYSSSNPASCCQSRTLIEHWNGTRWSVVPSPSPGLGLNTLNGVTAVSASDVWAVGMSGRGQYEFQTLIEHWDGTRWSVVPNLNLGLAPSLSGVTAVSASDIWAVGDLTPRGERSVQRQTLIEHWNGTRWSVVESPNSRSSWNSLLGVTSVSASDIWAVGFSDSGNNMEQTLIEHWNGTRWSVVESPNHVGSSNRLSQVAQIPHSSQVWAVGAYNLGSPSSQSLIEHYS